MKLLYLDCFSGISGDMTIGALLDAGGDLSLLKEELKKLHIEDEYDISARKVNKNGITGTKFDVHLNHNDEHTHHHEHSASNEEHPSRNHTHDDLEHTHTHEHTHDHAHSHDHSHRAYQHIVKMISDSDLSEYVKDISLGIFKKIGEAEGKIHGMPLQDVHFHEVGAVDSIIDIVGMAILMEQLEIDSVQSSSIPTGSGKIKIDHGVYPIPAPATLEILRGVPIAESELKAELTTPTGAGIVAVLAEKFGAIPAMEIDQIGYGAGTKTFQDHPNTLRVIIGESRN